MADAAAAADLIPLWKFLVAGYRACGSQTYVRSHILSAAWREFTHMLGLIKIKRKHDTQRWNNTHQFYISSLHMYAVRVGNVADR